jgi:hypothetical protein
MTDRDFGIAGAAIIGAAVILLGSSSRAAPTSQLAVLGTAEGTLKSAEQVQDYDPDDYYWDGYYWCWYDEGWRGSGWYVCDYGPWVYGYWRAAALYRAWRTISRAARWRQWRAGGAGRWDGRIGAGVDPASRGRIRCVPESTAAVRRPVPFGDATGKATRQRPCRKPPERPGYVAAAEEDN